MRWLLPLLAAGCASGIDDDVAYVILDVEARERGVAVEADGEASASALPIAVDPEHDVRLVGDDDVGLELWAGDVAVVRGDDVTVYALDEDVSRDALIVRADLSGLGALEAELGRIDVASGGDGWVIAAPDLLAHAAAIDAPDGVTEVMPVAPVGDAVPLSDAAAVSGAGAGGTRGGLGFGAVAGGFGRTGRDGAADADRRRPTGPGPADAAGVADAAALADADPAAPAFVGVWRGDAGTLILDASGRFSRDRDGARGAWSVGEDGVWLMPDDAPPELAVGTSRSLTVDDLAYTAVEVR